MVTLPEKYPELLTSVAYSVDALLVKLGFPQETAGAIAFEVAEQARFDLGGGPSRYVSKGRDFTNILRNEEIWERFKGNNYVELGQDFKLCEMRIRQIVEEMRKKDSSKRQGQLDLEGGED